MPYLKKDSLNLHYTDHGEGQPIITLHGLSESTLYWTLPGITDRLVAAGYRVINMDMRAHGRTSVSGEDKGYEFVVLGLCAVRNVAPAKVGQHCGVFSRVLQIADHGVE